MITPPKLRVITVLLLFVFSSLQCTQKPQPQEHIWWKEAIVYQIYPRSFQDSDGNGVGDLRGIIQRLDYIQSLGVTAVWLNPIYASPNADNGYDVSDYRAIMEEFGTMADFDEMMAGMHERGIKLVMDVVVNHSSDEHEWFIQSRSSRDNPYRNYYHWWPAEKGKPNYRYSLFDPEGNAWKYDSTTNAYYLHYFADKQPDLNWSNPKLRQEVYDIMKFWAEKGVDGFRLDAFQFVVKDTTFPAFPEGYERDFIQYYAMQPGIHEYLREMYSQVFSPYNVMSVAEGAGRSFEDAHKLVDANRNELSMAYAFEGVDIPKYEGYELAEMKEVFSRWDSAFAQDGWLSMFLSNHDQARMVSRWGNDTPEFREVSAKMLNTFILTMRGTPYLYYGDEIGMTNINFDEIGDYKDIAAINSYRKAQMEGQDMVEFLQRLNFTSRDNGRTPMQWDDSEYAGFTVSTPWLPVNPNKASINVEMQHKEANSVLTHFRALTKLRKAQKGLVYGTYQLIQKEHPQVYAYSRKMGDQHFLVLLNFSANNTSITLNELLEDNEILANNYPEFLRQSTLAQLLPYQAVILKLH